MNWLKLVLATICLPVFLVGMVVILVGMVLCYPFGKVVGVRRILNIRG